MSRTPVNPVVASIAAVVPCRDDEVTIASMVNLALVAIDKVGAEGAAIAIEGGSTDGSPP